MYDCSVCQNSPERKKDWGCIEKTRMSVPTFVIDDDDIEYRYWNCPRKFIPMNVMRFLADYKHRCKFPSVAMKAYWDLPPRYRMAYSIYENEYSTALKEKRKHG